MVRNGLRGRTQRYKCKDCGRRFDGGIRRDKSQVISDYIEGKQTLAQLASKHGVCEKTIRRDLEGMRYVHKIAKHKDVTIQMDTTYWVGQELWPYDYQGCAPECCLMAQICAP